MQWGSGSLTFACPRISGFLHPGKCLLWERQQGVAVPARAWELGAVTHLGEAQNPSLGTQRQTHTTDWLLLLGVGGTQDIVYAGLKGHT